MDLDRLEKYAKTQKEHHSRVLLAPDELIEILKTVQAASESTKLAIDKIKALATERDAAKEEASRWRKIADDLAGSIEASLALDLSYLDKRGRAMESYRAAAGEGAPDGDR